MTACTRSLGSVNYPKARVLLEVEKRVRNEVRRMSVVESWCSERILKKVAESIKKVES